VAHREIKHHDGVSRPPPSADRLILRLLTPAAPRSAAQGDGASAAVLRGLFNRVAGLARWSGIAVTEGAEWFDAYLRGVFLDASGLSRKPPPFRRTGNDGYRISETGVLSGHLTIAGDWRPLWPLLALGETAHASGRATQGYGRYRLEAVGRTEAAGRINPLHTDLGIGALPSI
jgi:hypothetical protein